MSAIIVYLVVNFTAVIPMKDMAACERAAAQYANIFRRVQCVASTGEVRVRG